VVASWAGVLVAESADTVVVDGNHYFPAAAVDHARLVASATRTVCGWKGVAHYASVVVGSEVLADAVWWYPEPFPAASVVAGRYAFGPPVVVAGSVPGG
jgi:uncharacterized protein (DUF427 family)